MIQGKIDFKSKTIKLIEKEDIQVIEEDIYINPSEGAAFTSVCGLFQFDFIKKLDGTYAVKQTYLL